MLNVKTYTQSNKLQDTAFVQLKNPETGALEVTESGEKVGFELHSMQSKAFARARRSTAHLGLTKKEQEREKAITDKIADGYSASEEESDFLDSCTEKRVKQMQRVFAMVTTKLHHIEINPDDAKELGVKVTAAGKVIENVDNIHNLYIALPDLSSQIGNGIATAENFTKS